MIIFDHLIPKVYADVVGTINSGVTNPYGNLDGSSGGGLSGLLTNVLRLFFVIAGIVAFFNFVIAGFQYMMAGGDAKKLQEAWDRIWQSLLGLIIIVGSFALSAIFGKLLFNNPLIMVSPQIFGPK